MPWINKPEKKQTTSSARTETDMRKLRQVAYQDGKWRKERDLYIHEHPLCADCLVKGKITPSSSVHHLRSPFKKGEINWNLLYDWTNLVALCHECHGLRHASQQGYISPEEILRQLDALFDENISDKDIEDGTY